MNLISTLIFSNLQINHRRALMDTIHNMCKLQICCTNSFKLRFVQLLIKKGAWKKAEISFSNTFQLTQKLEGQFKALFKLLSNRLVTVTNLPKPPTAKSLNKTDFGTI